MKRKISLTLLSLILFLFPISAYAGWGNKPTAIIVDADTGEPIEGAVSLAQWIKPNPKASWFIEGQRTMLKKAVEVYSDKKGHIRIDGFWGLYLFSEKPRLTVYKPGYVVWDNQEICPSYEKRKGFKKSNNIIRLKKFNTEYPKWLKEFSHIKYPYHHHKRFLSHCVDGEVYDKYTRDQISIEDIFYKYNRQHLRNEDKEISNNRN